MWDDSCLGLDSLCLLSMQTTCAQAIKNWEAANNMSAEDADYIKLYCQIPPIVKMDSSLGSLRNCE